jgi:hypothetical protein
MKNIVSIGLLGLALGAMSPHVYAQDVATQPVVKPLSIKLGAYLPTDGSGRNQGGSTQFAAGVDYAFTKTSADSPVLPLVYVDYQGGSHNGGHANLYDVGVGVRAYPNRSNGQDIIPFYGAGIGLDILDAKNGSGGGSTTKGMFAGKVELGVEMNSGPFAEAEYQIVPESVEGIHDSGFNVMIGDRF